MTSPFPESRIDRDRLGFSIDGVWYPPVAYMSYLPTEEHYRQIAACGIHAYCIPVYLAERGINIHSRIGPFRQGVWRGRGDFDFAPVVADLEMLLAADPLARVILRVHLDVPEWWEQAHPDGCCQRHDGQLLRQSFTSPVWRREASDALRTMLAWLADSPYAGRLAGIHVAAGGTEEWVYHYVQSFQDGNPSRRDAFAAWLRDLYGDDDRRRAAWAPAAVQDIGNALAAIEGKPENRWRDVLRDRSVLDALHFHSSAMADAIAAFCRVVKTESGGRLLTGAFYGYHFFITDARKGHTALSRLLRCPELDYIASPNVYDRSAGIDWPPMVAVDSVRFHDKLWMAENDTRTALTRPLAERAPEICPDGYYRDGVWKGPASLDTSAALLRANAARMLTHGYGGWWFDMWSGWFAHPALLAELAAAQALWTEDQRPSCAERISPHTIVVILDERLTEYDASFGALSQPIFANRYALGACGRPYVIYLRDDLAALDGSDVRFLWMLGVPALTPQETGVLERLVHSGGTVLHTDLHETGYWSVPGSPALPDRWGVKLSTEDLRNILAVAGVHDYLDTGDVLYVGRGYLAIHAARAGEKRIRLPAPMRVQPWLPEPMPVQYTDTLTILMNSYETRLFKIV